MKRPGLVWLISLEDEPSLLAETSRPKPDLFRANTPSKDIYYMVLIVLRNWYDLDVSISHSARLSFSSCSRNNYFKNTSWDKYCKFVV